MVTASKGRPPPCEKAFVGLIVLSERCTAMSALRKYVGGLVESDVAVHAWTQQSQIDASKRAQNAVEPPALSGVGVQPLGMLMFAGSMFIWLKGYRT